MWCSASLRQAEGWTSVGTKTDNHYLADKVALRVSMIKGLPDPIRVLDCYGGHGVVWRAVQRLTGRVINRTAIDMRTDLHAAHLHGDNLKVMAGLDLSQYDVIDLDAYGVPTEQLDMVLRSTFRGVVFVTMIQTVVGEMPQRMCKEIGLPAKIFTECKTIAFRRGWEYFCAWMHKRGVDRIHLRARNRKRYFGFVWNGPRQ